MSNAVSVVFASFVVRLIAHAVILAHKGQDGFEGRPTGRLSSFPEPGVDGLD
jgi:hypothetical protein